MHPRRAAYRCCHTSNLYFHRQGLRVLAFNLCMPPAHRDSLTPTSPRRKNNFFSLSPFPPALIGEPQPDSIQPWVLTLVTARPPRAQPCRSGPEVPSTSVLPAPSGANCSPCLPIDPLAIPVPVHRSIRTTGTTRNTPSDLSVHLPGCRMHPPRGRWIPFVSRQAAKLMPSTYGVRPLCTRACRTGYIVRESSIPGLSFECPRPLCTTNPGYSGHFPCQRSA